jgi:glutaminase
MLNFGMVGEDIEETLELYFQQCSILVNCRDLAIMGATLANGGVNPLTGIRAIEQPYVKYVLSVMLSCGMYDYAGEWAYRVGIPAKSGVGGGIVGVVPGQFGIGTFSPPLDAKGNSVRGIKTFRELSDRFGLHALESGFTGATIRDLLSPVRTGS